MSEGQIDPKLFRDNPDAVAAYLSDAFAKNDLTALLEAINLVMRAQNVQAMAREAGLRRDRLYKTFNGETNPMLWKGDGTVKRVGSPFNRHTPTASRNTAATKAWASA